MKSRRSSLVVIGALIIAVGGSPAVPMAIAGQRTLAVVPQPLRSAALAHGAAASLDRRSEQAATPAAEPVAEKPFFKTGKGITAAVLMTAGLAWLFYTKSHDRVTSPADK